MNGRLTEQQRLENDLTRAAALAEVRANYTRRPRHGPRLTLEGIALLIFAAFLVGVLALGLVVATAPYWVPAVAVLAVGVGRARSARFAERVDNAVWQARERVAGLRPAVRYPSAAAAVCAAFLAGWWALHYVLGVATALMVLAPVAYRFTRGHGGHYMHEPAPELDPADQADGVTRDVVAALPAGRQAAYWDALERFLPEPSLKWAPGKVTVTAALPAGFTPADVDLARFAHAHGVLPSRVRAGAPMAGHAVIEVLDVDPADMQPGPCPWLGQATRITEPMPLGVDPAGHPYTVQLADPTSGATHALVVGMKGSGKSWLMRLFALYAATDPGVSLRLIDCGGGREWDPFNGRADYVWVGRPDQTVVAHLDTLVELMDRRAAERYDPKSGGWVVVVIDEVHMLWAVPGGEAAVEHIVRVGRKFGVCVVLGTQLPNSKSVPTGIEQNCDVRVLMRASGSWAPQMVHTGAQLDATALGKGHGFVATPDAPVPTRVVTPPVDGKQAAAHLARVPLVPSTAPAAPTAPEPAPEPVGVTLADLLSALGDEKGAPVPVVAERLGVTEAEVRDCMTRHGLKTASYRVGSDSKRGLTRDHVLAKMQGENS